MSNDQFGLIPQKLDPESMEEILLICTELKEANFKNQIKDEDFFVNNLTPKIEKLNISYNDDFLSKHVVQLVKPRTTRILDGRNSKKYLHQT